MSLKLLCVEWTNIIQCNLFYAIHILRCKNGAVNQFTKCAKNLTLSKVLTTDIYQDLKLPVGFNRIPGTVHSYLLCINAFYNASILAYIPSAKFLFDVEWFWGRSLEIIFNWSVTGNYRNFKLFQLVDTKLRLNNTMWMLNVRSLEKYDLGLVGIQKFEQHLEYEYRNEFYHWIRDSFEVWFIWNDSFQPYLFHLFRLFSNIFTGRSLTQ